MCVAWREGGVGRRGSPQDWFAVVPMCPYQQTPFSFAGAASAGLPLPSPNPIPSRDMHSIVHMQMQRWRGQGAQMDNETPLGPTLVPKYKTQEKKTKKKGGGKRKRKKKTHHHVVERGLAVNELHHVCAIPGGEERLRHKAPHGWPRGGEPPEALRQHGGGGGRTSKSRGGRASSTGQLNVQPVHSVFIHPNQDL